MWPWTLALSSAASMPEVKRRALASSPRPNLRLIQPPASTRAGCTPIHNVRYRTEPAALARTVFAVCASACSRTLIGGVSRDLLPDLVQNRVRLLGREP